MESHPQMIQRYRDDDEEGGSVGVHAPLLPSSLAAQPRWAQELSNKSPDSHRRRRRKVTFALGALAVTYLLFCGWAAYARHETYAHYHSDTSDDVFPHPRFPWPHPPKKPHPPPPGPHPGPPPPMISVLGCVSIPTPDSDLAADKIKLSVSYATNASVVLHDKLLFGDVAVSKSHDDDIFNLDEAKEVTLEVAVKVAKLPPWPGKPKDEATADEEEEEPEKESFVLCATTLVPPSPPKGHPPHPEVEGPGHPPVHPSPPHHHGPIHPPPVIVDIFPALNETYPKLPPPPPPPPHGPGRHGHRHHKHKHSKALVRAFTSVWRNAVTFLFPMFTKLDIPHPPLPPKPHHPPHGPHCRPPPPPLIVTEISATIPKTSHVVYGLPPPPPPFPLLPIPHPPHGPH